MSKTNRIEQLDAYIVGDLAFIVEASWMEGFAQDIVFWEWGYPMQHNVIIGVPAGGDAHEYATGLASSRGDLLLLQIRDARGRAVAADKAS